MNRYFVECYCVGGLGRDGKSRRGFRTHRRVDGNYRDLLSCEMYWVMEIPAKSAKEAISLARANRFNYLKKNGEPLLGKMVYGEFS